MSESSKPEAPSSVDQNVLARTLIRATLTFIGLVAGGALSLLCLVLLALAIAYPLLPEIEGLADYRPKLPMRVMSADGELLGEFGEERRKLTPIKDIPAVMKNAVLAIEDARFYSHGGIDYVGVLRAGLANFGHTKSQGASTITMQVARNFYLSSEKTFTRKIYEILLAFKIENQLSKDQILEIYMNQIYLGQRAYGFSAAAEAYFGKSLKDISVAEAAMLAGLPKAPSAYNPISNPKRARTRQLYILERMADFKFITPMQHEEAKAETLHLRSLNENISHSEYVAEMARQLVYAQYGDEAYTRGLMVQTTLDAGKQKTAYRALRNGIMEFEKRQIYRGPEKFITLGTDPNEAEAAIDEVLLEHPDNDDLLSAVVLEANAKKIVAVRSSGETIEVTGEGLKPAQSGLSDKAPANIRIRRGAVIRIIKTSKDGRDYFEITQMPEVEGAFVALDPKTGNIVALVGGFSFDKNKFNHVTQAWRQPGSSFKPFIYSAALEKGFTPATVVNDAPIFFDASVTGSQPWEPKNYDGEFGGPMPLRRALAKSKNMVSIRILQSITPQYAQEWITRFGFEAEKHPAYLTMALGAGSVTPLQMSTAYSVFANGGYRVVPQLITRITDYKGRVLADTKAAELSEEKRAISPRNAYIMSSLLQEITRSGTAAKAQATLKRPDLYGKTGTTNDSMDAWFAGYQPGLVAVTWIGYDTPRKLGDRETGGGLSLPVWINFMEVALRGVPVQEIQPTEGVVESGGEWFFEEYSKNSGVGSVGLNEREPAKPAPPAPAPAPAHKVEGRPPADAAAKQKQDKQDEKHMIMNLFKN